MQTNSQTYAVNTTGLVVVDLLNDFLSPNGKAYPFVQQVVEGEGLIDKLQTLLTGARVKGYKESRQSGQALSLQSFDTTRETLHTGLVHFVRKLCWGIKVFYAPHRLNEQSFKGWRFRTGIIERAGNNRIFWEGTWGADYLDALYPQSSDYLISPHKGSSSFVSTDLDQQFGKTALNTLFWQA